PQHHRRGQPRPVGRPQRRPGRHHGLLIPSVISSVAPAGAVARMRATASAPFLWRCSATEWPLASRGPLPGPFLIEYNTEAVRLAERPVNPHPERERRRHERREARGVPPTGEAPRVAGGRGPARRLG